MPPRIHRNSIRKEAKRQLIESLRDLSRDAVNYDKGDFYAVNRSSVTLRSIFYHSEYSHSLIQTLDIENNLYFKSFAPRKDNHVVANYGNLYTARFLHFNYLNNTNEFQDVLIFNPFNSHPHSLPFEDWWEEPLIYFSNDILNRKQLILAAANQDGGAHFDANIKERFRSYYNFKYGNTGFFPTEPENPEIMRKLFGGIYTSPKSKLINYSGVTLALLRQVIHEVEISFSNWQKLPTNYNPNFNYNWRRKLNYIGWNPIIRKGKK